MIFSSSLLAATRQTGKILGTGTSKPKIDLSQPQGGWTADRMITVAGTVSDPTIDPIKVTINGSRYLLRVDSSNGSFKRKFPAYPGRNSVIVLGTNAGGTARSERSIYSLAPQVPITAILTSDTDGIYTDLHVYEPAAGLKSPFEESATKQNHIYWASTSSPSGGRFYLNEQTGSYDQPGYGPYLYTHVAPPVGIYRIDANYWPSGDKAHALANLNVVLNGGQANEIRRQIQAPLAKPGETVTLAWIRYEKDGKAYLYAPTMDTPPTNRHLWPQWVIDFKPSPSNGSEGFGD